MKKYRISNFSDDEVSPEETLIDSFSRYSKIETPVPNTAAQIFYALMVTVVGFYILASFKLQVVNGKDWRQLASGNRSSLYDIPAMRGEIVDQSGQWLAGNQPSFDLMAISSDLPRSEEELGNLIKDLSQILGGPEDGLREVFEQKKSRAVFFVKKDLEKEKVLRVQNKFERGVYVVNSVKRVYHDGSVFSSVVGYTGKVGTSDLEDKYYDINDRKGRAGIESSYEKYLRGEHGKIFFDQASKHYSAINAKPGQKVVLHIDYQTQKDLYQTLREVLLLNGLKFGSAVVQDPHTGEVLGLVSLPSFDNNDFSSEVDEKLFKKYFEGKDRPLFNRAIGGKFSPGSTIKAILALAGLKEGVISPGTTVTDNTGFITVPNIYNPSVVYTYRDWRVQGTVNLKKALAWSSDIYFYSVGGGYGRIGGLGFKRLEKYLRIFLIDKILGIDLPGETAGFVPDEKWKLIRFGQPWFAGDTYNVSIGQGDLLVTPLWLSGYISAIANGGTFYQPQVVKKIINEGEREAASFGSKELARLPFDRATLDIVREGLREVVLSGTGQILKQLPIEVAAKTGTAEVEGRNNLNSLVVAYAPYKNPEIAISVVVENIGRRQGLALLVAKRFFERHFKTDAPPPSPAPSASASLAPVDN